LGGKKKLEQNSWFGEGGGRKKLSIMDENLKGGGGVVEGRGMIFGAGKK